MAEVRPILSKLTDSDLRRFWMSVDTSGDCWTWEGCERHVGGYGIFRRRDRGKRPKLLAHRISLALRLGRDPAGMACHRCGNPACVRPGHLYEGDAATNAADTVTHGRTTRGRAMPTGKQGEAHHAAKLTAAKVAEARARNAAGELLTPIAQEFGVTVQTLWNALNGFSWRHVG